MKIQPDLNIFDPSAGFVDKGELVVDLFAGGGGASCGIETALGRCVDIAVNHDPAAVALHQVNHPKTVHDRSDVFEVDPREITKGMPVGFLWASPDCTYHSKARGAAPIRSGKKKRRALAWVVTRWAGQVRPRVIMLENVEEFAQWGPLVGKPDELRPCPKRRGRTFRRFVRSLERLGYVVEWRELRACDYGAPTIRKRLFLIARCDGRPIVWPEATHGPGTNQPHRAVAECIDWSLPMCSIFATPEEAKRWGKEHGLPAPIRPLATNTLRRIARGVDRFVLRSANPFLVQLTHGGRVHSTQDPSVTITTAHRGESAVCAAHLATYYGDRTGKEVRGSELGEPMDTQTTENRHAVVASFLAQHNGGFYDGAGHELTESLPTIVANGRGHQGLMGVHIQRDFGTSTGSPMDKPVGTLTTEGSGKAAIVASFMAEYYGTGESSALSAPIKTITTKDRMGLVTVDINNSTWVVVDIAMRMLQPKELYLAQGFPASYVIDRGLDGRPFTKSEQVRMVGNSVCPPVAEALVSANCTDLMVKEKVSA